MSFFVSIVIPAYNAASTLADTIASLQQQTLANWEAIVVDDGSQDGTMNLARQLVQQDDRFRLIQQPNQGVSVARNAGAKLATAEWLLFLDADDWIAPDYLEQMTAKITAEPTLDVVHCGWVRVTPDGVHLDETPAPQTEEFFPLLVVSCVFAIHACLVRRSRFVQAGGFDPGLLTCEDWDLWQRLARQGCRFGAVPATLAFYRLRPQSLSVDGHQVFVDGLRVIQQGHEPDARVANPDPVYANGLPMDGLPERKFLFAAWAAGLAIGKGADARPLLDLLSAPAPSLSPHPVVEYLVYALSVAIAVPPYQLWQRWATIADPLQQFLTALATTAQLPHLAARASRILERSLLDQAQAPLPLTIGQYYGVQVEVTEPIADILPPPGTSYLFTYIVGFSSRANP